MAELFTNFAESLLSGAIEDTDTSLSVTAGTGLLFPSPTGGNFFRIVAYKFATGEREVMLVTNRSTDTFTVTRAQEGTTALDLNDGDIIDLRPTAAFFSSMATTKQIQEGTANYAVAAGTANTLTATFTPTITALVDGTVLRIEAANDNTGAATLNPDGTGAVDIKKIVSGAKANLAAGDLKDGITYTLVYDGTDFVLQGPQPVGTAAAYDVGTGAGQIPTNADIASGTPAGVVADFAGTSAPSGWLLCYGQAVSRTTYAALFAVIGTTYGTGDGSTTFNVPDVRGRVTAGKDDMGGSSANRLTDQSGGLNGDVLGDTGGAETHALTTSELASHTHTGTTNTDGGHTHTNVVVNTPDDNEYRFDGSTENKGDVGGASGGTHNHAFTTNAAGSGAAHNNVQPTIIFNKIIKT